MKSKLKLWVDYPCDIWIDNSFISHLSAGKISVLPLDLGCYYIELYDNDMLLDQFDFVVEKEGYEYLVKKNIVKPPLFSLVENCNGYDFAFKLNEKMGLWNGHIALCKAMYDKIIFEKCYLDEPYTIINNNKYGLLSIEGIELVPCMYDSLSVCTLEPGNLEIFSRLLQWLSIGRVSKKIEDWLIKRNLNLEAYTKVSELCSLLPIFFVQKIQIGFYFGFIDITNEILCPIEFEDCKLLNRADVAGNWMSQYDPEKEFIFDRGHGPTLYFGVQKNGKWGIMANSQLKTKIEFDECDYYNYGIFTLRKGERSCAWDINNGILIDWLPNEEFKKEYLYKVLY